MRGSIARVCAGVVLAASAPVASADFVTPDSFGWARGAANSTHFQWEVFTSAAGPNAPDAASFPAPLPAGWETPNAFDSSVGGFVTGGGNLYNIGAPLIVTATMPGYDLGEGYTTRVLLQARTLGTEIDPASVTVNGVPPSQTQELYREPLGGFGGAIVEVVYYFEVPGNAASYTVRFDGAAPSLSLDRLSLDTVALEDAGGCPVDQDGNGLVNSSDISAFLTAWLQSLSGGTLAADFNADGAVNSGDISAFLSAWLAALAGGC